MTEEMIEAFVTHLSERADWLLTLRQIREAHGCPCTRTTHVCPRERSMATGMMWMENGSFVPGRPVRNCGLCGGVGVAAERWAR